jgi:hypothetical protein
VYENGIKAGRVELRMREEKQVIYIHVESLARNPTHFNARRAAQRGPTTAGGS